jgi:hypothetical protein
VSLSRDAILAASDLDKASVDVPEWGGSVNVRQMTAADRDAYEAECYPIDTATGKASIRRDNIRARLLARTVCSDDGNLLFTFADVEALGAKSSAALERVYVEAKRINGMLAKPDDAAKN